MWYLLKVEYDAAAKSQSKVIGFSDLQEAKHVFGLMELSYQFGQPVRLKNGERMLINNAWLYESFRDHYAAAVEAIASGEATLMSETKGVNLDLS